MAQGKTYNPGYKSVGFRDAVVYELDSNGYPAAPSTAAYVGYYLRGPKAFTLNIPNPRIVPHIGRDRVEETDQLSTNEAASGEIRTSGIDLEVDAFLQGTKKDTVGLYSEFITRMTDKQGAEPQVGVIAWQQALLQGARRWHYYLIPSSRAIPINAGMEENPVDHRYSINISPVEKLPWGTTLTEDDNGSLQSGYVDLYSTQLPLNYPMVSFKGNGVATEFTFDDYKTGRDDYPVFVNGVLRTTAVTKIDGSFEFTDYPAADGAIITVWLV